MNTTERLAFRLVIAEPNTTERTITVCPRYDGLKLKWSRPSGQMYYTEDISGTVKFLGVDFQTINACALNTQFTFIVYQNRVEVGRSIFKKTDCKWDIDHGVVEVDVSVYDKYKKFQDKKDEEYNLVRLGIEKRALSLWLYPARQIYFLGDTEMFTCQRNEKCTSFSVGSDFSYGQLATMHFNVPTSPTTGSVNVMGAIIIDATSASGFDIYRGTYYTTQNYFVDTGNWFSYDKIYEAWMWKDGVVNSTHRIRIECHCGNNNGATRYRLHLYNGTTLIASTGINSFSPEQYEASGWNVNPSKFTKTTRAGFWLANGNGCCAGNCRFYLPMARTMSGQTSETYSLRYTDLLDITSEHNSNWRSARPFSPSSSLDVCFSTRTDPNYTEYGIVEGTDYYYAPPTDDGKWAPVFSESWFQGVSVWVGDNHLSNQELESYKQDYYIRDFYLLTDAIRAVVQKIDENIQFDSGDSRFLFQATNPLNGIQQGPLYISQKSNILNLGYDYPAWLAPVKWSQIETLLREAFDCYWSLYDRDGQKHLRIEHRKWYENGGNYTQPGVQVATIDLTSTYRNGTPFTFGEKTRHWEFDTDGNGTVSTASRHEYGWMDTQSEIFDGQPITVPEAYRLFTDEKVEQHKVDWFSSDIDFLTSVQAECSSDGFVIVMENPNAPNWIVTGAAEYSGQNYQLSFDYLQDKYLLQGIYAEVVMIGDNETLTNSNARMRTSEVQLRSVDGREINASDTIKTAVGIGVIDTLEYDLHSQLYTVKLRYENE